jgi:hypothetical protein
VSPVAPVTRLVTFVDLDLDSDRLHPGQMSVSARLDALLADGRRVTLLDDRGWGGSGPPDVWATTSMEEVVFTARTVVGPDEPPPGRTHEEEAALHWAALAGTLRRAGVAVEGFALSQLPHDVVLSDRLLARLNP